MDKDLGRLLVVIGRGSVHCGVERGGHGWWPRWVVVVGLVVRSGWSMVEGQGHGWLLGLRPWAWLLGRGWSTWWVGIMGLVVRLRSWVVVVASCQGESWLWGW